MNVLKKLTPQEAAKKGIGRNGLPPPIEHRFKKGNNANPGGRPKGLSIVKKINRLLMKRDKNGMEMQEGVALALIREALQGDVSATKELIDRVDGRVKGDDPAQQQINIDARQQTIRLALSGNDLKEILGIAKDIGLLEKIVKVGSDDPHHGGNGNGRSRLESVSHDEADAKASSGASPSKR